MSFWRAIASSERLLRQETGAIIKDWGGRLPIALIYPNHYAVGMSSLGFQTIYRLWNDRPDVVCERIFDDGQWDEPPPRSIERQRRLNDFPIWAFSRRGY